MPSVIPFEHQFHSLSFRYRLPQWQWILDRSILVGHRRRSESDQPEKAHSGQDERSRSSKRPEPPQQQLEKPPQEEVSTTDDPTSKGGSQLAIKDKPARARPRFDPTEEHVVAQKIAERAERGRMGRPPPREKSRDPSTEGPPTREEERRYQRRPPLPPPATSQPSRQIQGRARTLTFPPQPRPKLGSATESSTVSAGGRVSLRLRTRTGDNPPQRPMPMRTSATPIGGSVQQQPLATPHRQPQPEYYGQSRFRDDRSQRWDQSGGWQERGDHQERSRSRQWQDDQQWTEQPWYTQERQDWGSTFRTSRDAGSQQRWQDQQDPSQRYQDWNQPTQDHCQWSRSSSGVSQNQQTGQQSQHVTAAQYWSAQQLQQVPQQQSQLPALPAPVYPPGMQPTNIQAPPGLGTGSTHQPWQGGTAQNAPLQFGSAAVRQQSPFGSHFTQGSSADRQQSPFGPHTQPTAGNHPFGYQ